MALLPEDFGRISTLARLAFEPAQAEQLRAQLNDFFSLVEAMKAVDTTDVEPLPHPFATIQELALRLADDQVLEPNRRQTNMVNAPACDNGVFLVPRVIE